MSSSMRVCAMAALVAALCGSRADALVSYTGGAYTQDFDTLITTGTNQPWANDTTIPGWSLFRQPSPGTAITTFNSGTGSSNAGNFYSFGIEGVNPLTERALGGIASGGAYFGSPSSNATAGWIAVGLTNGTASPFTSFTANFDGEQWRDGGVAVTNPPVSPAAQTMVVEYGFGATFETVATWTAPGAAFDFTSPIFTITTATGAALDGNDAANRTAGKGGTVSDISWDPAATLWIRWTEKNDPNNDHGLAIDNFSFSATGGGGPALNADFDGVGGVNGTDFLIWQQGLGSGTTLSQGDANGSNTVDGADLQVWRNQFPQSAGVAAVGAVPEPGSLALAGAALAAVLGVARRRAGR
jgi:hypothetical protein